MRLHPQVRWTPLEEGGLALFDERTELHIALEVPPSVFESDEAAHGDVAELLEGLGMTGALPLAEVRRRQVAFRQEQARLEQSARLEEWLPRVIEQVPYYRARADAYRLPPSRPDDPLGGLPILTPILTKSALRAHFPDLWAEGIDYKEAFRSGELELVSTSGTTEERIQAIADATISRVPPGYAAVWALPPQADTPRTAVLTAPACTTQQCSRTVTDFRSRLSHETTLFLPAPEDLFAMTRADVRAIADEMWLFGPTFLFVNPVYAHWMARRAREWDIRLPPVRAVLSCYQYLSRMQKRALAYLFDAPVYNMYSATELGGCQVGVDCRRGRMHLRLDHCIVELLGGSEPVPAGALGQVVITTLAARAVPLVRYAVGDLGSPSSEPCDCELADWPCFELHGRANDCLSIDGRRVTTKMIDDLVGDVAAIDFYSCRQDADGTIELQVIPALDGSVDTKALREALAPLVDPALVRVRTVSRLEPAPSLKFPLTRRVGGRREIAPGTRPG